MSNGQVELFVVKIKGALKRKACNENVSEVALEKIYDIIRMNYNTPSSISPTELMFAIKIITLFDKLVPGRKIKRKNKKIEK